jgi:transcriptional regulator with XRE-family HTH domain
MSKPRHKSNNLGLPKRLTPQDREVGRRIKLRRHELGISQTELGDALNVTFQQVQKYENGANRVSAGRLQNIAKVLKVPITFFFDDLGAGGSEIPTLLESAYALRVLKAFSKIRDRNIQSRAVELMEAMANAAD